MSALIEAYTRLRELNPRWVVEIGVPTGERWLAGRTLTEPESGPLADLLAAIGARLQTQNRKVIAASFALRFGWSSAAAIAPWLVSGCVPDVSLDNVSLRFTDGALFEQVAVHDPRVAETGLRAQLIAQATPVVDALQRWSHFPRNAIWGQIASSWGAQFEPVLTALGREREVLPVARAFFDNDRYAPRMYEVQHCGTTHVYHMRSTCCLYYKAPEGNYCASCPLISEDERLARNKAWMERLRALHLQSLRDQKT